MAQTITHSVDELRSLLREADHALARTGEKADRGVESLRQRLHTAIEDARPKIDELRLRARDELYRYDDYVRTHPYYVIGAAALVGALVGIAVSRRF